MQYELFNWERRVNDPQLLPQIQEADWLQENARIKGAFLEVLLSREPPEAIERYVQVHQTGLLQLSKVLEAASQGSPAPFVFLFACLDDLCVFLERYCVRYLASDAFLPSFRSRRLSGTIREKIPLVRAHLKACGTDPTMASVIGNLLEETAALGGLTYRQWFPLKDLMEYIVSLPAVAEGKVLVRDGMDISTRIMELLLYLNVNTLPIYRHAKDRIMHLVEEKEFALEQLPELDRVRRYISWLEQKPGYRYMESRGSLLRMLTTWLDDVARLKEKEARETADKEAPEDDSGFGLDSKKVITSLTVNELGLLVRLFMETGVFRTRNRKGLARFMAQNVVTLKKEAHEEMSSNHLYGTLYSMTDATMDSVQAILNRMIVRLGKLRLEQRGKKPPAKK
jgi:hypothetical protein